MSDEYVRVVSALDKRAHEFMSEDGEGGMPATVHRMADEIDRLREELQAALEHALRGVEAVAHVFSDDLEKLESSECAVTAYSIEMGDPDRGETVPLYTKTPAPVVPEHQKERLRDAIAETLGDSAYDCTRVWSAWSVGTMGPDDFAPIVDDDERLSEIVCAALDALNATPNPSNSEAEQ